MTDEKTRALIAEAERRTSEWSDPAEMPSDVKLIGSLAATLSALTLPDGDVRERLAESIAGGTISIPGGYAELARDDAESIVDTILGNPVLSRAAAPEAVAKVRELHRPVEIEPSSTICHECSHQLPSGDYAEKVTEWPCATLDALGPTPEPEWEWGVQATVNIDGSPNARIELATEKELPHLRDAQRRGWCTLHRRRKAGPWEPLPVGGETE
ncbi:MULTISPECIES: hypothetical protein [unclassified Leucobacter]|uniref:hypothetical protein n=1 Tax=unclassified Leucobacter TaxID=2621730 RepID=UPI003017656E